MHLYFHRQQRYSFPLTQLWQLLLWSAFLGLWWAWALHLSTAGDSRGLGSLKDILDLRPVAESVASVVPILTWLMGKHGWKAGYHLMAVAILVMFPIALFLFILLGACLQPYENGKLKTTAKIKKDAYVAYHLSSYSQFGIYLIILFCFGSPFRECIPICLICFLEKGSLAYKPVISIYSTEVAVVVQFLAGMLSAQLNIKRTIYLFMD